MSLQTLREIAAKTRDDEQFRKALVADPAATVAFHGWEVSPEELEAVGALREEDLAELSPEELYQRFASSPQSRSCC